MGTKDSLEASNIHDLIAGILQTTVLIWQHIILCVYGLHSKLNNDVNFLFLLKTLSTHSGKTKVLLPHAVINLYFESETLKRSRKANGQGWWGRAVSGTAALVALTSLTFPSVSFNYTTALSQYARWLCM